jgi:BASS family bile acid:Na+ symporter
MLRKALTFYTQYFTVWVVLFGAAAYYWPGPFLWVGGLKITEHFSGTTLFFALTMFGIGAVLEAADFKRIGQQPWIVAVGCTAQYTIMPIGGFVCAKVFDLPPEIAVGLILTGCAPGAMASNVMCYVAKADTAYSVSLTTASTLLCPVLMPGLTKLLAGTILPIDFWKMCLDVVLMVVIPLLAGFGVRYYFKSRIERIVYIFPAISATFIVFVCSYVIAANKEYLAQLTIAILAAVLILNLYGMAGGYGVGAVFGMEVTKRRTLSIEVGMQNAGLGTVLAVKHFGPQAAIPSAIFVFVCIVTAALAAAWWQRSDRQDRELKNSLTP